MYCSTKPVNFFPFSTTGFSHLTTGSEGKSVRILVIRKKKKKPYSVHRSFSCNASGDNCHPSALQEAGPQHATGTPWAETPLKTAHRASFAESPGHRQAEDCFSRTSENPKQMIHVHLHFVKDQKENTSGYCCQEECRHSLLTTSCSFPLYLFSFIWWNEAVLLILVQSRLLQWLSMCWRIH